MPAMTPALLIVACLLPLIKADEVARQARQTEALPTILLTPAPSIHPTLLPATGSTIYYPPTFVAVPSPVGSFSENSTNKGAIAGGVAGGLAVLVAIIAALLFFKICKRSQMRGWKSRMRRAPPGGQWIDLEAKPKFNYAHRTAALYKHGANPYESEFQTLDAKGSSDDAGYRSPKTSTFHANAMSPITSPSETIAPIVAHEWRYPSEVTSDPYANPSPPLHRNRSARSYHDRTQSFGIPRRPVDKTDYVDVDLTPERKETAQVSDVSSRTADDKRMHVLIPDMPPPAF